ncbi:Protein get1 [Erysiphe neolycopersici]|uniref:Protein get1 n=1 Tax=Erysiphe neolycopersici TaxID=212602 RepID=A0A420HZ59_9PEZI|nr:Protein get1 [Erysiphe neolycopersici]
MPSILLSIFLIQLAIYLIEIVAVSTVNNQLWKIWNSIFSSSSKDSAEYQELKNHALKLRRELNVTSSQDEFAKWAKLRRQYDKAAEKLEKAKTSLDSTRSKFDSKIMVARWICTKGIQIILQFSYQKRPMFYLPKNWIPYYAEWVLSFPRAPLGSISQQIWSLSCKAFITLMLDLSLYFIAFFSDTKLDTRKQSPGQVSTSIDSIDTVKKES